LSCGKLDHRSNQAWSQVFGVLVKVPNPIVA